MKQLHTVNQLNTPTPRLSFAQQITIFLKCCQRPHLLLTQVQHHWKWTENISIINLSSVRYSLWSLKDRKLSSSQVTYSWNYLSKSPKVNSFPLYYKHNYWLKLIVQINNYLSGTTSQVLILQTVILSESHYWEVLRWVVTVYIFNLNEYDFFHLPFHLNTYFFNINWNADQFNCWHLNIVASVKLKLDSNFCVWKQRLGKKCRCCSLHINLIIGLYVIRNWQFKFQKRIVHLTEADVQHTHNHSIIGYVLHVHHKTMTMNKKRQFFEYYPARKFLTNNLKSIHKNDLYNEQKENQITHLMCHKISAQQYHHHCVTHVYFFRGNQIKGND